MKSIDVQCRTLTCQDYQIFDSNANLHAKNLKLKDSDIENLYVVNDFTQTVTGDVVTTNVVTEKIQSNGFLLSGVTLQDTFGIGIIKMAANSNVQGDVDVIFDSSMWTVVYESQPQTLLLDPTAVYTVPSSVGTLGTTWSKAEVDVSVTINLHCEQTNTIETSAFTLSILKNGISISESYSREIAMSGNTMNASIVISDTLSLVAGDKISVGFRYHLESTNNPTLYGDDCRATFRIVSFS